MKNQEMNDRLPLPDRSQRQLIASELDRNMLVEAAAGTGKTASMVSRMVALLARGKCTAGTMAAVTFTRKAAAELRSRFQIALEKAVVGASGREKELLADALEHVEGCFIGTIHSFCARLLRERPVEAGVNLAFEELEEQEDMRLREEAWDDFAANLFVKDRDGLLVDLEKLGLQLRDIKSSFFRFADYPDIEAWPVPGPEFSLPPLGPVIQALRDYAEHMSSIAQSLPMETGQNRIGYQYERIRRMVRHANLDQPPALIEILRLFSPKPPSASKGLTGKEKELVKEEKDRWSDFAERYARPACDAWLEFRYRAAIRVCLAARNNYDRLRAERGKLNYADLLIKAAALLRDKPHVRRYFRRRFTHLLVDEFQDTDPIQAEVLLLLTSADEEEADWRKCAPCPGSLFIVGDPKQSIYRFRRADIVTYNNVRKIIKRGGGPGKEGLVVSLSANFRATGAIVDWVNMVFRPQFPGEATDQSPAYVPLELGRSDACPGDLSGIRVLSVPEEHSAKNEIAVEYEADFIARWIRHALDSGLSIPRTDREIRNGIGALVSPGDFLIVTMRRRYLSVYARKLQEYGIGHQVTGGKSLNEVEELRLLYFCLRAAIHPDNPVALVAALRSELFGISDAALYRFKKAGGRFDYLQPLPELLDGDDAAAFRDVFMSLHKYFQWLVRLPLAAALENITADLGLMVRAAIREGGEQEAGSLAKALELVRGAAREMWSVAQLEDYLSRLVQAEEEYDGIPVLREDKPVVRIMNLHKVKGLESPVVFLADPTGEKTREVEIHIDRTGEKSRGYMLIRGENLPDKSGPKLAQPPDWEALSALEKNFLDREALRLRYVAATRAGSLLVITRRGKKNDSNPWGSLAAGLEGVEELITPELQVSIQREEEELSTETLFEVRRSIGSRLETVSLATYDTRQAKEYALSMDRATLAVTDALSLAESDGSIHPVPEEGEHGVEWGQAIHQLLRLAVQDSLADLEKLAGTVLKECDLDPSQADKAIAIVRSVMRSDIWKRSLRSARRLAEVPFQLLLEKGRDGVPALPTVLRGAIDLVFREEEGWVLVDYKTDSLEGQTLEGLVEEYRPQVRLYARAWESLTGEKVKEAGLFFTRIEKFVLLGSDTGG